ncbi:Response regulator protein TodT [Calycomorphotria hydatis]|uniref:Response regulator protein TodT n=2 Tax=Calycomorphotria hydatis TaxID=2528027 RepID=A0A517T9Z0_9PLAN|nr:Response regulator protein TodT [Calycomorphotria hydatis]
MTTVGIKIETYDSAEDFQARFIPNGPGCLVFDVRMPATSGLDLYEQLLERGVRMPVIFMTAFADVPMAVRAMKSGAVEFVEKPFNRQELLDRVQRALREDVLRHQLEIEDKELDHRFATLTDKEKEVLMLVQQGVPNKSIASKLGITSRAVEMRRAGLMKKLGVNSLAELLRISLRRELSSENRNGQ